MFPGSTSRYPIVSGLQVSTNRFSFKDEVERSPECLLITFGSTGYPIKVLEVRFLPHTPQTEPSKMKDQESPKNRILLVEDEAIIALAEKQSLEKHGYEVVTAYSGEKAVETATEDTEISLVLMDIDLGSGIDGTEAAQQILKVRSLPIVFLTSHSEREYVDRVKKITSYGYVLKGSGEFVLIEAIEMAFELFRAHEREKQRTREYRQLLQSSEEPLASYDEHGRILVMNQSAAKLSQARRQPP